MKKRLLVVRRYEPVFCGHDGSGPCARRRNVRYAECQRNHAASAGGHAVDGCGEFMAGGEEGSREALKCAACGCHRSFHRRVQEAEGACQCTN